MNIQKWIENNTESLKGKTVAITGSTGGIGKQICNICASLGASLILVDRNKSKSSARKDEVLNQFPETKVITVTADMTDISCVKSAVERLKSLSVDILILNAGAYSVPKFKCDTGYNNIFQINFISQYYIARELAPYLKKRNGRVVAVGSIAYRYSGIDANDVDFSNRSKSSLVYGNSKRYLMFSLFGLSEKFGVPVSVVHPGITFTNITSHYPPLIFAIIKRPMKLIFMSNKKASLSVIKGVFEATDSLEWIGPKAFDVWGYPVKRDMRDRAENEYAFILEKTEEIYNQISH